MNNIPRRIALSFTSVAFALGAAVFPAQAADPDLVITEFSVYPNPVMMAHEFVIKYKVVNQGQARAPASEARWTIAGNPALTAYCSVPALAKNKAHQCSWTWLSAPNKPGNYGTRATADYDRSIREGVGGEANNVETVVLRITP